MAAIYGNSATRDALTKKLAAITDRSVRVAMLSAILHLSPQGDVATAAALEALPSDDEIMVTAQRLRARAR